MIKKIHVPAYEPAVVGVQAFEKRGVPLPVVKVIIIGVIMVPFEAMVIESMLREKLCVTVGGDVCSDCARVFDYG